MSQNFNSKSQTILTHPSLNIKPLTSRPHIFMAMGVPVKIYNTSLNSQGNKGISKYFKPFDTLIVRSLAIYLKGN
jgi:hypothetical protein